MGLLRLGASISTLGVVDPRSHAHRTATNTKRIARSSAATAHATEALDQRERERELREQGLIGFNATADEVRAVEARLAFERRQREAAQRAERRVANEAARVARLAQYKPLPRWAFWTLGVLALLFAVTLVGIPVSALIAVIMVSKHPWKSWRQAPTAAPSSTAPAASAALTAPDEADALTEPIALTVPIAHPAAAPRPLVGAGRHARRT